MTGVDADRGAGKGHLVSINVDPNHGSPEPERVEVVCGRSQEAHLRTQDVIGTMRDETAGGYAKQQLKTKDLTRGRSRIPRKSKVGMPAKYRKHHACNKSPPSDAHVQMNN